MGRPDEISLIFDRRICPDTESGFMTKVVTRGVDTTVNFFYRHSRIKEYLKDGRALRIETVVNSTRDLGVAARLPNLPELITKARDANDRLLHAQRVGQSCVLANRAFERVALPTVDAAGKRAPALRFGDPRVMALVGALTMGIYAVTGFSNRSLRARVAGLLDTPLQRQPDGLRPGPAPPKRTHRTPRTHQHLRPDRMLISRGHTGKTDSHAPQCKTSHLASNVDQDTARVTDLTWADLSRRNVSHEQSLPRRT